MGTVDDGLTKERSRIGVRPGLELGDLVGVPLFLNFPLPLVVSPSCCPPLPWLPLPSVYLISSHTSLSCLSVSTSHLLSPLCSSLTALLSKANVVNHALFPHLSAYSAHESKPYLSSYYFIFLFYTWASFLLFIQFFCYLSPSSQTSNQSFLPDASDLCFSFPPFLSSPLLHICMQFIAFCLFIHSNSLYLFTGCVWMQSPLRYFYECNDVVFCFLCSAWLRVIVNSCVLVSIELGSHRSISLVYTLTAYAVALGAYMLADQ